MAAGVRPAACAGLLLCAALTQGCASAPDAQARRETAAGIAQRGGLSPSSVPAGRWTLRAYAKRAGNSTESPPVLRVYIEGDGFAWRTRREPSQDPTPIDPIGLRMAAADRGEGPVLYLARPCQYIDDANAACTQWIWTDGRFSARIVDAYDGAIGRARLAIGARSVELAGYSGGGVLAALVAARRSDVTLLATVAAPLSLKEWANRTNSSPLAGSLDPADFTAELRSVRQVHFVGRQDQIVPPEVARAYLKLLGRPDRAHLEVVADFNHRCCWATQWPRLMEFARAR